MTISKNAAENSTIDLAQSPQMEHPVSRQRAEAIELTERQLSDLKEEIANHENKINTARLQVRPFHIRALADARIRLSSLTILLQDLKRPPQSKPQPKPEETAKQSTKPKRNSERTHIQIVQPVPKLEVEADSGAHSQEPIFKTTRINSKPFRSDLLEANRLGLSILVNQDRFFPLFFGDLDMASKSVEIICPFVKTSRLDVLDNLEILCHLGIQCFIYTRPPNSSDAKLFLDDAKSRGINTVSWGERIHNKVAIIDNQVVWEGSLNILSHSRSEDSMRRLVGRKFCEEQRALLKLPPVPDKPCCSFKHY